MIKVVVSGLPKVYWKWWDFNGCFLCSILVAHSLAVMLYFFFPFDSFQFNFSFYFLLLFLVRRLKLLVRELCVIRHKIWFYFYFVKEERKANKIKCEARIVTEKGTESKNKERIGIEKKATKKNYIKSILIIRLLS